MAHLDVLRRDAELLGDDLRERGLVALALGLRADADHRLARRVHAQVGAVVHGEPEDVHVLARPRADALGEERHADAHQLAAGALLGLLAAQVLVAGDLHRDAHRLGVVAGVVGPAGRRLIRELLGADEAAHAQVDRVGLHLERERVDHALDEVDGLGDAERAAVGDAAGRLVRVDRLDLDVRGLQVVGPADDVEEPGRELRRLGGAVEGAVVGDRVDPQACDLAVLRAHLAVHDVVAGKAGGHQVLGAVLDPLDRHAGHDRAGDRAHVARVDGHLVAKAAADVVAADPDHVLGEPRHVRVDGAVGVRRLVAVVEVELAGLGLKSAMIPHVSSGAG